MIPFVAMAAISFGIHLSANIISFIVDEKSKVEQEKQEKFLKEYEKKQKAAKEKREQIIKKLSERYSSDMREAYEREKIKEENQLKEETKAEFIAFIQKQVSERIIYVDETLLKDISNALNTLKEKKMQYNSSLRFNSFRLLRSELEEAKNKALAYKSYLKRYEKKLSDIYDCCDNLEDMMFSFILPKEFPYKNKIIFLTPESFDKKTGIGRTFIHGCIEIDFYIIDYDFYKNQSMENFIVMMLDFDCKNYRNNYSIQHGRYKQIEKSGGFTGITAKVNGFDNQNIILICGKDMRLNLNARNLYNFNRYPATGAEITVFPIGEYYSSEEKRVIYNVSQRQEDAEISLDFHKLSLILPKNKVMEFIDYYEKHSINLNLIYDDVKVAPVSENATDVLNPEKFKIQFGEYYTMVVEIKSSNQKQYLWFDSFIDNKHLSAEDIFIPFNAEIDVLNEIDFDSFINNKSNAEVFENMNSLILTIFKEFNLQHKLKNSKDGM